MSQAIYYAPSIAAGPAGTNQVMVVFDRAATFVDVRVTEYAGLAPTAPFDAGRSAIGVGTSADSTVVTATPSELLFAAA